LESKISRLFNGYQNLHSDLSGRLERIEEIVLLGNHDCRDVANTVLAPLRQEVDLLRIDHSNNTSLAGPAILELETRITNVENELWTSLDRAGISPLSASLPNDLGVMVNDLVEESLIRHSKDRIAKRDFALLSGGGSVVQQYTSLTYKTQKYSSWKQLIRRAINDGLSPFQRRPGLGPEIALHPDISVGRCWAFTGGKGRLTVSLPSEVLVSEITIDHVAPELSRDHRSAPRDITVWGLIRGKDNLNMFSKVKLKFYRYSS
jgi:hypothetical protein